MSEYQYYEFAAVDRPLTPQQQAELRSCSSRATITAGSFINEYQWGDLKGEPLDWMKRYFDAHVYSASWGTCRLLLRLPAGAVEQAMLDACTQPSASGARSAHVTAFEATFAGGHCILDWSFGDDAGACERFWSQEDGPGWLSRLLPLRDELLRGDARPLYLGWLARLCAGELADDDTEPPLPAGLSTLTPAQQALAEFLELDPDWLHAAAAPSPPESAQTKPEYDTWLARQPESMLRATVRLLLEGRGQEAESGVRRAFLAQQRGRQNSVPEPPRRSVAQIATGAPAAREQRLERERLAQAAAQAKRQAERSAYLVRLAADPGRIWEEIDALLERGSGLGYDQALGRVLELAEALRQANREDEFRRELTKLLAVHGKRPAWVARLNKSGIIWKPES